MGKRYRMQQINALIKQEVGRILMERVRDPRVEMVTITEVRTTPDLQLSRIYFSVLNEEEKLEGAREGLERASGFIRKLLGERLTIRYTPELKFYYDESTARGDRIMRTLRDLRETGELDDAGESESDSSE
jgi:ribosome-binding factor A